MVACAQAVAYASQCSGVGTGGGGGGGGGGGQWPPPIIRLHGIVYIYSIIKLYLLKSLFKGMKEDKCFFFVKYN